MNKLIQSKKIHLTWRVVLMMVTFLLITVSGILLKQAVFRLLPLYISMVVVILQSKVSRYAPLVGGINSVLYAIVYLHYHLYASFGYAILISFPLQLVTFILWSKKPWQDSTVFRRLDTGKRVALAVGAILAWVIACRVFGKTGASYKELDTAVTVIGIIATVMTMLSYYEYGVLNLLSNALSVLLYFFMLPDAPEQLTYMIFSVYGTICSAAAAMRLHALYQEQQNEKK